MSPLFAWVLSLACNILIYAVPASAAFRPADLKNACETMVFQALNWPPGSTQDFASAFENFESRAQKFIKGVDPLFVDGRLEVLSELAQKWLPAIEARVQQLGIGRGQSEVVDDVFLIYLDRANLLAMYPELRRYLPEGYKLAVGPIAHLTARFYAAFNGVHELILVPMSLLYKEPDAQVRQGLAHELLHLRLFEMRNREGLRLHNHAYQITGKARELLGKKFFKNELNFFSSEEALAYLVTGLNEFEAKCSGRPLEEYTPSPRDELMQSKNYVDAMLDLIYPSLFEGEREIVKEDGVLVYYGSRKDLWVVPLEPDKFSVEVGKNNQQTKQRLLADIRVDRNSLLTLRGLFEKFERETRFAPKPEFCNKTEPFWNYLEGLGLNTHELRVEFP